MQQSDYMAMMQGDDGTLSSAELIAAYEQGIADLRSAVAGMSSEQVLARPVPGKWSTVECVGHLADTEIFFTCRSSPSSGRRWGWVSREHDPGTDGRRQGHRLLSQVRL